MNNKFSDKDESFILLHRKKKKSSNISPIRNDLTYHRAVFD